MMAMQPFLTTMKTETACDQAPHLRDRRSREATCEWHAKGDVRAMCRQKKKRAHSCVRARACRSRWRGCSQSITFLGSCARSVFGEPVYSRNSEEKFDLFTY